MKHSSILKTHFFLLLLSAGLLVTLNASAQEDTADETAAAPAAEEITTDEAADTATLTEEMPEQAVSAEEIVADEAADTATLTEETPEPAATAEKIAGKPAMSEEMMAKWKEASTPNSNHEVLDRIVGEWDHTLQWWMSADAQPEESTGTSKADWIMDGRFVEHNVQGMSMGQPFAGKGIIGYDNVKKQYTAIWLDNMGTGIMQSTGQYDAATNTLSETGNFSCPFEGDKQYKAKYTFVDENHYTYELFMTDMNTGKEFRSMLISYTRQK